jgi:uncharacterized membrane protein YuzA (DUF378 family)
MSKSSKSSLLEVFAYVAIVISAIAWLLVGINHVTDWNLAPRLVGALQLVATILTFIVVAVVAYGFTKGKSTTVKVIYWVIVIVFLVCVVFGSII